MSSWRGERKLEQPRGLFSMKDVGVEIPKADCRKLNMGGWEGAKIQTRISGQWAHFYTNNGLNQLNASQQVDFQKKWKPPKRSPTSFQKIRPTNFDTGSYAPELILSQSMSIPVIREPARPKTAVQIQPRSPRKDQSSGKVHVVSSDQFVVPTATPIIRRNEGNDTSRFPFRVNMDCIQQVPKQKRKQPKTRRTGDLFVITSNVNKSARSLMRNTL